LTIRQPLASRPLDGKVRTFPVADAKRNAVGKPSFVRTFEDLVETVRAIAWLFKTDKVFIIGSQSVLLSWPDAPIVLRTSGEIDAYPENAKSGRSRKRSWTPSISRKHPKKSTRYSAPISIESFNGRLRDELLNETLFVSLAHARVALGCWRTDYNDTRPHSQLGWKTPSEFAFICHPRRDLALRYAKSSAPAPGAPTTQPGKSNRRGELRTG
jgi:hypothetical protein